MNQNTQLGYLILLADESRHVNWLHYASYKRYGVVRSALAAETYAFIDFFYMAYVLRPS